MDTEQKPNQPNPPSEPSEIDTLPVDPALTARSRLGMFDKAGNKVYLSAKLWLLVATGMVMGLAFYGYHNQAHKTAIVEVTGKTSHVSSTPSKPATPVPTQQPAATNQPAKSSSPQTQSVTPSTNTKSSTPAPPPTPAPTLAPWVNTTNCLPQNPNQYETYYANMTNSQYLQTDGYVNTDKLYAALQFAGLLGTINSKQYVVLAMDDAQWNFTQTQLDWLNADPAHMRQLLGWQVITSCITYNGVNPIKNMANGTTQTVNTLNGPVTFTARANGGLGTFDSGSVGIWDWFTSNGSVTICGFVKPSAVP